MIRQSLFRQRFTLTVLRLFAFTLRRSGGRKEVKWLQINRRHSCILFHKPVLCFETINKRWFSDDPSCIRINLPALTPTMETGTIVKWYKKEGEKLNEGDALVDIETDKATIAFESPYAGYLAKILIPEGTKNVPVGQLLCVMVENKPDISKLAEECYAVQAPVPEVKSHVSAEPSAVSSQPPGTPTPTTPSESPPPAAVPVQTPTEPTPGVPTEPSPSSPTVSPPSSKRVFASPLAVKQAVQKGIDLKTLAQGTGIWSSIKAADLQKGGSAATTGHDRQPVTFKANKISMELANSKKTVPHYYLIMDINVNKISEFCQKFNYSSKTDLNLGIKDFIFKAAALSCIAVPETNSSWMDTFIRQYKSVNINIAIYLPSGLVMPVLFDTEKKTLLEINKNIEDLIQKAKEEKLEANDSEVGTFTITILGMYSISTFIPTVRPPQSCALAVGTIEKRISPFMNATDVYEVDELITATLSCDHRVVDGAKGAQWLHRFKQLLEDPQSMLL